MAFTPQYHITAHTMRLIESIATLKTKIEAATVSVSWIPSLSRDAISRTARSSTAIEGNPLTLKEVRILAEGGELPEVKDRDKQEVLNYLAALRFISGNSEKKSLTEKDILKLHKLVGNNVLDRGPVGQYRDYEVTVGEYNPPHHQEVTMLMEDLIAWVNGPGQGLPAVISSAIVHYQLETIHPFGDGNGRVGRLIGTWELYRRKFDTHHIFAVDEVYNENKQFYYRALYRVQSQQADLTGWIEYVCESVEETLERVWQRIVAIRSGKEGEDRIVLTPKQEVLVKLLKENALSIRDIQEALKVTKPGAHFVLKPLIEAGIVKREGGYKSGKYSLV